MDQVVELDLRKKKNTDNIDLRQVLMTVCSFESPPPAPAAAAAPTAQHSTAEKENRWPRRHNASSQRQTKKWNEEQILLKIIIVRETNTQFCDGWTNNKERLCLHRVNTTINNKNTKILISTQTPAHTCMHAETVVDCAAVTCAYRANHRLSNLILLEWVSECICLERVTLEGSVSSLCTRWGSKSLDSAAFMVKRKFSRCLSLCYQAVDSSVTLSGLFWFCCCLICFNFFFYFCKVVLNDWLTRGLGRGENLEDRRT